MSLNEFIKNNNCNEKEIELLFTYLIAIKIVSFIDLLYLFGYKNFIK